MVVLGEHIMKMILGSPEILGKGCTIIVTYDIILIKKNTRYTTINMNHISLWK